MTTTGKEAPKEGEVPSRGDKGTGVVNGVDKVKWGRQRKRGTQGDKGQEKSEQEREREKE